MQNREKISRILENNQKEQKTRYGAKMKSVKQTCVAFIVKQKDLKDFAALIKRF